MAGEAVGEADGGWAPGRLAATIACIFWRAAVLLAIGEKPEVAGDVGGGGDDIGFSEAVPRAPCGSIWMSEPPTIRPGLKVRYCSVAQLFAEAIEDAGCFIDSAIARGIGEDTGGMAGLCGDIQDPAAGAAAGGRNGVEAFGGFESEGNIAGSCTFDEIMPGYGVGCAGAFLVAGEISDEFISFNWPVAARAWSAVMMMTSPPFISLTPWPVAVDHSVLYRAGGHIGFEDGIEVADEEEVFAFFAAMGGDEVAGAVEGIGFVDPFGGKPSCCNSAA